MATASAALSPGSSEILVLGAAFIAGTALERYRQGRRERPMRLSETPGLWVAMARESVGMPATLLAAGAVIAALVVLVLPSISPTQPDLPVEATEGRAADQSSLPRLKVLRPAPGSSFAVGGARFRVFRVESATSGRRRTGSARRRVKVGVTGQNLRRSRFNPNHLSYRLVDARGNAFHPESSGGSGPSSLGETGFLRRGDTAQARLGFLLPPSARGLSLVFELPGGRVQVRIPLESFVDPPR
jgi:hypothetical protein